MRACQLRRTSEANGAGRRIYGRGDFVWRGLGLCLRRRTSPVLELVPDEKHPHLFRIRYPSGWTSSPANLTRARDAAYGHARLLLAQVDGRGGAAGWRKGARRSGFKSRARGARAMTPAEKFQLGCEVRARGDILPRHRLIFAAALDRLNCKTGRCDPSRATLGADTSSSESTVRRALECLQEKRLIWIQSRRGRDGVAAFPAARNLIHNPGHSYERTWRGRPRSFGRATPVISNRNPGHSYEPRTFNLGTFEGRKLRLRLAWARRRASLNGARQQAPSPDVIGPRAFRKRCKRECRAKTTSALQASSGKSPIATRNAMSSVLRFEIPATKACSRNFPSMTPRPPWEARAPEKRGRQMIDTPEIRVQD